MADISAAQVKQLRDMTGAGMMDAKRALQDTDGDIDAAVDLLRKKGMASAAKRAGRETTEGIVLATVSGHVGTIVAVGCETEPVSKNEEFVAFAEQLLETVEGGGAADSLEDKRVELSAKLGENIAVVGTARFEASDGESIAEYVHAPANKIGVLLKVKGENPAEARRLGMQIASGAPEYVRREDVPEDAVAKERGILAASDEVQSKPEQAREKIVEGMLNKRFFGAYPGGVLLDQPWIHDSGKNVAAALGEAGLEVIAFERFALAG